LRRARDREKETEKRVGKYSPKGGHLTAGAKNSLSLSGSRTGVVLKISDAHLRTLVSELERTCGEGGDFQRGVTKTRERGAELGR